MRKKIAAAVAITIGVEIVVIVAVALIVIYSGAYNVAAAVPHSGFLEWILDETVESSVKAHARGIEAPDLSDPARVKLGYDRYTSTCMPCHGAPGVERGDMAKWFYPKPPELTAAAADWTPSELYWIASNGIKDTAMPAFKPTHSEEELWAVVAFASKLPGMTQQDFEKYGGADQEHSH